MINFSTFNYFQINQKIQQFIIDNCQGRKVIIGLSGGLDSTLTCQLAVDALGTESVKALIVKNIRYSTEELKIARSVANKLGIEILEVDTNDLRSKMLELIKINPNDIREISSLDARLTDLILRTVAYNQSLIYLGTINGTERLTGWYPKGALSGDFCPIGGLLKHQVQELAKYLKLPGEITNSISSDASQICSGCGQLEKFKGIYYDDLDLVLYLYETVPLSKLFQSLNKFQIDQKVSQIILNQIKAAKNKQDIFCPYPLIN